MGPCRAEGMTAFGDSSSIESDAFICHPVALCPTYFPRTPLWGRVGNKPFFVMDERAVGTGRGCEISLMTQPSHVPCSLARAAGLQVNENKFNVRQCDEYHNNSRCPSNSLLPIPLPQGSHKPDC